MKKSKKIILIICLFVVLVGGYFTYKGVNWFKYKVNDLGSTGYYEIFYEAINNEKTMTIKKIATLNEEYLKFDNLKIKNDFKDFEIEESSKSEDYVRYYLKDKNDGLIAGLWLGKTQSFVDIFINQEEKTNPFDREARIKFFEDNKITNDMELFDYLAKNKAGKTNIFTSVKEMKRNYAITFLTAIIQGRPIDNYTIIEGDYTGYMFDYESPDNLKECNIIHNGKRYIFTFIKGDFTDERINEILNTLVIE